MRTTLALTADDQARLDGSAGPGVALAMRIVVAAARASEASRLVEVSHAHVDSCLYHGRAGLDFARRLVELGARVTVPTTLNVGSLDLLHPGMVRIDDPRFPDIDTAGRQLMQCYVDLGARPTWTCAPYQVDYRPARGEHVAWAESNAVVFANSVLGACTDRYGDFLDICAAITAVAPYAGLHVPEHRAGGVVLDCTALPREVFDHGLWPVLLGDLAGRLAGGTNPVLVGLPPDTGEDDLKALGAVAASSGAVGLFHAVGVTPEADDLATALQGREPVVVHKITTAHLAATRRLLSTVTTGVLDAVALGTPHASPTELQHWAEAFEAAGGVAEGVDAVVTCGRSVYQLAQRGGLLDRLSAVGVRVAVDTCSYVAPILRPDARVVMTNSGKWARYAPANLGVDVVLGSLPECVASARAGRVVLDAPW